MENLTHALYLAFAMMAFIIALSVSIFMVNRLNSTSKEIIAHTDTRYYDSLDLTDIVTGNDTEINRSRIVGVDTIIPTLYRYYKESFAVKILDSSGNLLQYFDTTTESDVNAAKTMSTLSYGAADNQTEKDRKDKYKALLKLYDNDSKVYYMFGAPWLANINKDAKTRVDMYINGGKGFINNVLVDYSATGHNLKTYKDRKFREVFTQYAYEGDTVMDDTNGEITTLTGNKQVSTKIVIIYQIVN